MSPTRFKLLLGAVVVLAVAVVWHWISGWGLVTVQAWGQPVGEIIKSIERQGGIEIVTNVAPDTKASLDVYRVTPVEAVDALAARLDGSWSIGYVAGASKADLATAIASLSTGERSDNLRTFGFRGGGGGFGDMMPSAIDARLVEWNVSPSETSKLQSYLEQLSFKTGLMAAVPQAWDPDLPKQPRGGKAGASLEAMVKSVKGVSREILVLRVRNEDALADAGNPGASRGGMDGGFGRGNDGGPGGPGRGGGREFRPEWMQERVAAQIAQLPKAEREQAKKEFDEMRAFFEKVRALPEQERRAAMESFFNSPVVQERMAERMAERDEKSGPERRADRARRYIERKQAMQAQQTSQ
jgi:hypothetical protein